MASKASKTKTEIGIQPHRNRKGLRVLILLDLVERGVNGYVAIAEARSHEFENSLQLTMLLAAQCSSAAGKPFCFLAVTRRPTSFGRLGECRNRPALWSRATLTGML